MKRLVKWLIPAALLALMTAGFSLSAQLNFLCPAVSLRYSAPLTAKQVQQARAYTEENGTPYLTFWTESQTYVAIPEISVPSAQILYNGDPALSYPVTYRHGGSPGMDKSLCSVSVGLAWELWQSDRVVGMTVQIDGAEYTISGVFEGEDCRLFRWTEEGFTAAEVAETPKGQDSYRYALDLAAQSGLGLASGILWGSGMAAIGRLLCWLPLLLAGCCLVSPWLAKLRRLPGFVWGILALAFVLALPAVIDVLPGWMIPTRWSDFGFYSRLWDIFCQRWEDLLMLAPTPMDAQRKLLFLGQLFCSGACCVLTLEFKRILSPKS